MSHATRVHMSVGDPTAVIVREHAFPNLPANSHVLRPSSAAGNAPGPFVDLRVGKLVSAAIQIELRHSNDGMFCLLLAAATPAHSRDDGENGSEASNLKQETNRDVMHENAQYYLSRPPASSDERSSTKRPLEC